jgi:predicted enzyme related to lactoylglutathione lyase
MRRVVHFEIPADDEARAGEFYRDVFDWQVVAVPEMDYTTLTTTPIDEQTRIPTEPGGINGGLMKRTGDTPAPVITVEVDAIDDALKRVEASGGSTVTGRTEIPNVGAFAYFKDSEGNVLGLFEPLWTAETPS